LRLYKYTIAAGESQTVNASGRFVRGMAGAERYQLSVDGGALTNFETGIAMERPEPFSQIRILNTDAASQEIEIAVSDRPVFDNRLVGTMDLNGAIGILTTASLLHNTPTKQTIAASTAVLAANADRRAATIQIDTAAYIDSAADGILMPAGSIFQWEAQTALTLVPLAGNTVVRILEETNA